MKTELIYINDMSGSMDNQWNGTITGFNEFIKNQKEIPGDDVRFTYVQFDDQYELVYNSIPLEEVPPLTKNIYKPRGWTALYDAVGRTIYNVGKRLYVDNQEPVNVIFAVKTDGMDNKSTKYTKEIIEAMVKLHIDKYKWEVIYLANDEDTMKEAQSMGFGSLGTREPAVYTSVMDSYEILSETTREIRTKFNSGDTNA